MDRKGEDAIQSGYTGMVMRKWESHHNCGVFSKEQGVQTPHWASQARGSATGRQAPRMSGSEKTVELVLERARQL